MTAVEKLLATARAEIGYLEKETNAQLDSPTANAGDDNWNKFARDLDQTNLYNGKKNGYAWCDIFVDWCFVATFGFDLAVQLTCQELKGCGAGCTWSANYYKNRGQFHTSNPQPGDQIFFTNDGGKSMAHTGIVEKVEGGRVYTIEGNTSSTAGMVANGGCVRNKSYSLSYANIGGYGRPNYALVPVEQIPAATAPEAADSSFKEEWNKLRKELQDNDCGAWSAEARAWAISNGLIAGAGPLPDGTPNYMWADMLTREQAIMLFYRFATMMGKV